MTRSDALRNRQRVLDAAAELFAEEGLDATIEDIAHRAGVGKATVYRSFPTKEHLVAAIVIQRVRWFQERAEAAAERQDGFAAFEDLLVAAAEVQAGDRVLAGALAAAPEVPELAEARAAMRAALERVLDHARESGELRADTSVADVHTLFGGVARTLHEAAEHDVEVWRRYARLVARALRA